MKLLSLIFKEQAKRFGLLIILIIIALETLSYLGYIYPLVHQLAFIVLSLAILGITIYRLEYGLLLVLSELFIGSLGYLFSWSFQSLELGGENNFAISWRTVLWLVVLLVFGLKFVLRAYQARKTQIPNEYWQKIKSFPLLKFFGLLFIFVGLGLINGLVRHANPATIFVDFNSWLYFALLFPFIAVYYRADDQRIKRLKTVFLAAVVALSLKTLFLLFVFTHNILAAPDIYLWLRRTLTGEMTPTKTGWPRIFMQSQIFSVLGFILVFWFSRVKFTVRSYFKRSGLFYLGLGSLFFSAVIISFSRSFWVSLVATLALALLIIWRLFSFKRMLGAILWLASAIIGSFIIIYLVVGWPYFKSAQTNLGATLLARVSDGQEAALTSRWSLLPELVKEIKRAPLLGQGYGATVTYFSQDPRVLAKSPSGQYTTYIFEWSYLDLWLKLGLLGLLAYLLLLTKIISRGLKRGPIGLALGLIFLVVVNIFTPYFNHPLGIGWLLISSCLIWRDRVY